MRFDRERIRSTARKASTEDLLDRVTVYGAGMEPQALEIIEEELRSRRVRPEQIEEHRQRRGKEVITLPNGSAAQCSFCHQPAVGERRGWHRLLGLLPLFPRTFYYCAEHRPLAARGRGT